MFLSSRWLLPFGFLAGLTFTYITDLETFAFAGAWSQHLLGGVALDYRGDLNGGGFVVDVIRRGDAAQVWDVPASYHHLAAGFSFADGHAEIHRWRDARTPRTVRRETVTTRTPAPNSVDVAWLQEATTARELPR